MLVICLLLSLAACGNNDGEHRASANPAVGQQMGPNEDSQGPEESDDWQDEQEASDSSLISQQMSLSGDSQEQKEAEPGRDDQRIDVDLTQLSSTMVYSEVFNMMYVPEDYIGKTVKMNGAFALYSQQMDENGQPDLNYPIYYACVIADATACCSQGLGFVLNGNYSYPDDYPEIGEDITVVGTFETYEEDGNLYCHLVNAEMEA